MHLEVSYRFIANECYSTALRKYVDVRVVSRFSDL